MKLTTQLKSGNFFDYTDPEHSEYEIEDIAWGLSHICRFSGQCNRFYSVAEHCCLIYDAMVENKEPKEIQGLGLMHDASEAFCMDMHRPLKMLLPEYKAIEERVEKAIMAKYGLTFPYPSVIKEYDNAMLLKEQAILFDHHYKWSVESSIKINPNFGFWGPREAYLEFIGRWHEFKYNNNSN